MKRHVTFISVMFLLFALFPQTPVLGEGKDERKDSAQIARLLKEISRSKRKKVKFTETKLVRSLDLNLKSSGVYIFRAAGQLEKITENPFWERILISKDTISVDTKDESHVISIDQLPSLKIIVESVRSVFSGNLNVLREMFRITLIQQDNAWSLQLNPRERSFNQRIKSVTFSGSRGHVSNIRIMEFDGDEIFISLD